MYNFIHFCYNDDDGLIASHTDAGWVYKYTNSPYACTAS